MYILLNMRSLITLILVILFITGCGVNKKSRKNLKEVAKQENKVVEIKEPAAIESPIVVRNEKVTAVNRGVSLPSEESYFVIMGSFKILDNAKRFQTELSKKGFSSQLLRNDDGLYRVSVNNYSDIEEARKNAFSIRKNYPAHQDVWLLRKSK